MKKPFTILVTLITLVTISSHAAKIRANNTGVKSVSDLVYRTLDSAYNAAKAGDTIYVEPSVEDYTISAITKKIILIGNGYFLNENAGISYTSSTSNIISNFNVEAGAAGSLFTGLNFKGVVTADADNLSFYRNKFNSGFTFDNSPDITNHSNIVLIGNFIEGNIVNNRGSGTFTNLIISNNFISSNFFYLGHVSSGTCSNNTLIYGPTITGVNSNFTLSNFVIQNNIFAYNPDASFPYRHVNSTFKNNICSAAPLGYNNTSSTGNVFNVNMTTVFEGTGSSDGKYKLKTNSPAIGAGVGGVDCGAFGGSTPYMLSGQPNIPSIYYLSVPANSNGNTLNITLSTKSNP